MRVIDALIYDKFPRFLSLAPIMAFFQKQQEEPVVSVIAADADADAPTDVEVVVDKESTDRKQPKHPTAPRHFLDAVAISRRASSAHHRASARSSSVAGEPVLEMRICTGFECN